MKRRSPEHREEEMGGEEVNTGRGEICVTAAAWGSHKVQQGMLLMDMSDIVLTSSLWTHIHTEPHTHVKTYRHIHIIVFLSL